MSLPGANVIVAGAAPQERCPPAQAWQAGVLLVALTLAACLPALRAGFVWEDDRTLTHNPHLQSLGGLAAIWFDTGAAPRFRPLTQTALWVESRLWGAHPAGYHVVSVLLHVCNVLLLWTLLRRLGLAGAWLIAALFAVHPVQADAIAWISQRAAPLSGMFYLAALLGYLRWCGVTPEDEELREQLPLLRIGLPQRPRHRYAVTLLLVAAAMLCDPAALTWPIIVLLIVRYRGGAVAWADLRPLVPAFGLALTTLTWTMWVELNGIDRADEALRSLGAHVLLAPARLWINVCMLLLPPAAMLRPSYTIAAIPPAVIAAILAVTALLAAAAWRCRTRPSAGAVIAMLMYVVSWLPSVLLDALPGGTEPLHNLQYLACVPLLAAIVAGIAGRCAASDARAFRPALRAGAAVVLLSLAGMMFFLTGRYDTEQRFWQRPIADHGARSLAQRRLAKVAAREGRMVDAAAHYRALADLSPGDVEAPLGLAAALERLSRQEEASAAYLRSLELAPGDPRVMAAVASFETRRGNATRARELYDAALRLRPGDPGVHSDLALLLDSMQLVDEAIAHCRAAIETDPAFVPARLNLATLLFRRGDFDAAAEQLQQVVRDSPRNFEAYANGGAMLAQMKQYAQAERMFRNALLIRGDSSEVWANLALTLQAQGRTGEAEWSFSQAKRYAPQAPPAE